MKKKHYEKCVLKTFSFEEKLRDVKFCKEEKDE